MLKLDDKSIRSSLVNASRREATELTLPADFDVLDWDSLDYLGFDVEAARDARIAALRQNTAAFARGLVGSA